MLAQFRLSRRGKTPRCEARSIDSLVCLGGDLVGDERAFVRLESCRELRERLVSVDLGVLAIRGKDVAEILIGEGLARRYVCGATRCPKREKWCEGE
jgi:hypothetical protein